MYEFVFTGQGPFMASLCNDFLLRVLFNSATRFSLQKSVEYRSRGKHQTSAFSTD